MLMNADSNVKINRLIPVEAVVITAAIVTGALAGFGAFFLKSGLTWIGNMLSAPLAMSHGNYMFVIYSVIAILGAVAYQKGVGENLANGTSQLKQRVQTGNFSFRRSMTFTPLVGCLVTVGLGGSAGAEGPCAFAGAAIGDRISSRFKLTADVRRILFGCGAAAGIAGIFKSPLGGVFFALEILGMELTLLGTIAVTFASLSAFGVAYILSGYEWNVRILTDMQFVPEHFGWIALLGVASGLYSIYYSYTHDLVARFFKRINNVWVKASICGLVMGGVIYMFPAMFGEGYNIVSNVVNDVTYSLVEYGPFFSDLPSMSVLLAICGGMLLLKGAMVGAVNFGGGVAGEFVPTIFAGCLLGFVFASVGNMCGLDLPVDNFALIGTAAVMAGAVKAPLMSIFIAAEVSDRYGFILAFIVAAGISYTIVLLNSLLQKSRK